MQYICENGFHGRSENKFGSHDLKNLRSKSAPKFRDHYVIYLKLWIEMKMRRLIQILYSKPDFFSLVPIFFLLHSRRKRFNLFFSPFAFFFSCSLNQQNNQIYISLAATYLFQQQMQIDATPDLFISLSSKQPMQQQQTNLFIFLLFSL